MAVTSLGLAGLLAGLLSGCSSGSPTTVSSGPLTSTYASVTGNWQFSSTAAAAARLSVLGGSLSVDGTAVTGILHPLAAAGQCVDTSVAIPVTGSIDASSHLSLSAKLLGGAFSLSGTLSEDRKSLTDASYTVTGGSCAFPSAQTISARDTTSPVTAVQYTPISGTYTGTLTTSENEQFTLSSVITQSTTPDANGIYHVAGTASSPGNSCLPLTLPATASTVVGGNITTTYSDGQGTTVTGAGNTSVDGKTITINSWNIASACGTDTGTGVLTQQPPTP